MRCAGWSSTGRAWAGWLLCWSSVSPSSPLAPPLSIALFPSVSRPTPRVARDGLNDPGSGITPAPRRRISTFISLPDEGLLRRFTASRHHPANVAPATDTSLRESIARRDSAPGSTGEAGALGAGGGGGGLGGTGTGRSPVDIAKLMAGYTVEGMSFEPADRVDLERLLGIAQT